CNTAAPALAATARAFELSLVLVVISSSLSNPWDSQHCPRLAFAQEVVELAGRRRKGGAQCRIELCHRGAGHGELSAGNDERKTERPSAGFAVGVAIGHRQGDVAVQQAAIVRRQSGDLPFDGALLGRGGAMAMPADLERYLHWSPPAFPHDPAVTQWATDEFAAVPMSGG